MDTTLLIAIILIGLIVGTACLIAIVLLTKSSKKKTIVERERQLIKEASIDPPPPPPPQQPQQQQQPQPAHVEQVPEAQQPLLANQYLKTDEVSASTSASTMFKSERAPPPPPSSNRDATPLHLKLLVIDDLPKADITLSSRAVALNTSKKEIGTEGFWETSTTANTRLVWNTTRNLNLRKCDCDAIYLELVTTREERYAHTTIRPENLTVSKRLNIPIETVDGNIITMSIVLVPPPTLRRIGYIMKLPGDLDPQTGLTDKTKVFAEEIKTRIQSATQDHKDLSTVDKIIVGPTISGVQVAFITLSSLLGNCKELAVSRYAKLASDQRPASTHAFVDLLSHKTEDLYNDHPGVAARYLGSFPINATELGTSSEEATDVGNCKEIMNQVLYGEEKVVLLVLQPSVYYYFVDLFTSPVVAANTKNDVLAASSFSLFKLGIDADVDHPIVSINPLITGTGYGGSASPSPARGAFLTPSPTPVGRGVDMYGGTLPSASGATPSRFPNSHSFAVKQQELERRELALGGREVAVLMRERQMQSAMGRGRGRDSQPAWL
eukprot:TRINITY_DN5332_c1_g1_i1.p1 TRINITY_DN5332_c1_g1~~TRINITY_DN5332_c1_g1_i1.p1  ORF type:complete len:566 (+),score=82.36 TRINITY_DN5332_c1_g1_i1:45-1700(+)